MVCLLAKDIAQCYNEGMAKHTYAVMKTFKRIVKVTHLVTASSHEEALAIAETGGAKTSGEEIVKQKLCRTATEQVCTYYCSGC